MRLLTSHPRVSERCRGCALAELEVESARDNCRVSERCRGCALAEQLRNRGDDAVAVSERCRGCALAELKEDALSHTTLKFQSAAVAAR